MTQGLCKELDEIWNGIDEANIQLDVSKRSEMLNIAIRSLQQLIDRGVVEAWYPLGYAYYCHPERKIPSSIARIEAPRSLEMAITLGVEPTLSNLFLAYDCFDHGKFDQAAIYTHRVVKEELCESLYPRLNELKLCIGICRSGLAANLDEIRDYADQISRLSESEIPPLLLMNTIESQAQLQTVTPEIIEAMAKLDAAFPVMSGDCFRRLVVRIQDGDNTTADNS